MVILLEIITSFSKIFIQLDNEVQKATGKIRSQCASFRYVLGFWYIPHGFQTVFVFIEKQWLVWSVMVEKTNIRSKQGWREAIHGEENVQNKPTLLTGKRNSFEEYPLSVPNFLLEVVAGGALH